jgi:hypothetical protein
MAALAERWEMERSYGDSRGLIRVDTFRKRVIIATGGQDWQPFSVSLDTSEPEKGGPPTRTYTNAVVMRNESVLRWCQGMGERQVMDDLGSGGVVRIDVARAALVRLAQASKGWTNA